MIALSDYWRRVEANLPNAKCVAWDGCHKIYVALDDEQAEWFRAGYPHAGYPHVVTGEPSLMLDTLRDWYDDSCGLRFIQSVTTAEDMNRDGFRDLIPQGAGDE